MPIIHILVCSVGLPAKMPIIALPLLLVPFLLEESDRLAAEQSYDSNAGFLSTHP